MASNAYGVHPSITVNRVASVDKKRMKVSVSCPKVVSMYKKYQGGVDRFDENVDSERVSFRGKNGGFHCLLLGLKPPAETHGKSTKQPRKRKLRIAHFTALMSKLIWGCTKPHRINQQHAVLRHHHAFIHCCAPTIKWRNTLEKNATKHDALSATTEPGFSAKSAKFRCTSAAGTPFTTRRQDQRTTLLHD